ncbi:MAG: sigma-70 family RNA polymerase sigma factor [Proteobacteria bacterium]|nr:sigma-70 family RNA polymerase sigma factor [Pseudomonadota bacterium]
MATDLELLDRWRAGDLAAGNALFDRYFDDMCRFFENKRCHEVEDLVQSTFMACVKSRDRFREQSSFRTYLFSIARNQLYKYFRQNRRHGADFDIGVTSLADLETGPVTQMARDDEHRALLNALCTLPLDQQLLLEMYYWESMDIVDLAEIFDIAPATVRTRLFRARQMLRETLAKAAGTDEPDKNSAENFDAWVRSMQDAQPGKP